MNKYIVTARVARLMAGVLTLTDEQSAPRAHNLKALGKNRFEIIAPVEFKSGEEIGYESTLPKILADQMITEAEAAKATRKPARAPRAGAVHESPAPTEAQQLAGMI